MVALRQAGLVQTTRGRGGGTVVILKPPTPSARAAARTTPEQRADWLDSLAYRRIIEPGAAAMVAEAELDEAARAQLLAAHEEVATATKPAHYRQSDSRFHLTIAALTGSRRVIESVTSVQATLHEMLLAIPQLDANIAHSDDQHAAVVRAIVDGRPDRARRAMEQHCDDTAALLRGLLT
jgi:GntR family transcriptional repressor for pyruvate dehydrogenase complex